MSLRYGCYSGNENEVVTANKPRKKPSRGRNISKAPKEEIVVETTTARRKVVSTVQTKRKPARKDGTTTTPAPPTTPDPGSGNYLYNSRHFKHHINSLHFCRL